jgi:hypothetical protein
MDAETEKIIMSPLQLNNNAGAARSSAVGGARPSNTAGTSRPSANVNSSNANSKTHRSSSHVGNLAGSPTAGSGTGSLPTSMASSPATQRAIAPARADSGTGAGMTMTQLELNSAFENNGFVGGLRSSGAGWDEFEDEEDARTSAAASVSSAGGAGVGNGGRVLSAQTTVENFNFNFKQDISVVVPNSAAAAAAETSKTDDFSRLKDRMWEKENIGLYAHYAAVGFVGGIAGMCLNFCVYSFNGAEDLCPNAQSIIFLPWSFKIFYAIFTDSFRPFGLRRKPYILAGWAGVLILTLILAITAHVIGAVGWVLLALGQMFFLILADVPADGYSVQLGQLEHPMERGQILATGQRIRFICYMLSGFIQAFLLNGPHTNPSDCQVGLGKCFRWGLTVNQYYGLLFAILAILFVPMTMLKERFDNAKTIHRDLSANMSALWSTLQSRTTLFLIIFVSGNGVFGQMPNQASVYLQYYVIGLNNFQSGIDAVTTYLALVLGIYLFQRYLIRYNWQLTQYFSNIFTAVLAIQWLFAFNDVAGLRNGWFTIFINTNQQFSQGITQVLFAMAVIEIAVPGQEAITYELIISTYNSALTINTMLSTQFLHAAKGSACKFTHWCVCVSDVDTTTNS